MTIKEIKERLDEENKLIYAFYIRAWKSLVAEDYKAVVQILHHEMPVKLWDRSLFILDNNHISSSKAELKHLIEKVDKKLEDYFCTNKEEEELINDDNYVKSIFKKRKYKKI